MANNSQPFSGRKRWGLAALALLTLVLLLAVSTLANARALLADFTPTAFAYFPILLKQSTPTPSPTLTPTITLTPSKTPTPTNTQVVQPGTDKVSGQLTLEDQTSGKTYAAKCEDVWHYDLFHNDDSSLSAPWGIMGVSVSGPNTNFFHTSWSAPDQPNQEFVLNPGCYGPIGTGDKSNPAGCNRNPDSAKQRDRVGGRDVDTSKRLVNPGQYRLDLAICLSPYDVCPNASANPKWKVLSSVTIQVVDWYDPVKCPEGTHGVPPVAWPSVNLPASSSKDPLAGCHLDERDPANVHLVCPGK